MKHEKIILKYIFCFNQGRGGKMKKREKYTFFVLFILHQLLSYSMCIIFIFG